jgi:hypothetical protein
MRKSIVVVMFLLPTLLYAQSKAVKFYATPNLFLRKGLSLNAPIIGAGLNGGVRLSNFGFGAGAEYFKIYSDLKSATPVFIDVRYFFSYSELKNKTTKLQPFIAANFGKMIWNASQTFGSPIDNSTTIYEGKLYYAIESGVVLSKRRNGFLVGFGYKSYGFERLLIKRTSILPNGTIGPVVETRSPVRNSFWGELALRVGYQF